MSALLSAVPVTLKSRDRAFYPFQRISLLFCCSRKRQWIKNGATDLIYKTKADSQKQKANLWLPKELREDREAALAWASLAQRFPASRVLARERAGCGSVGDVTGAWLASAPLSPSLWT